MLRKAGRLTSKFGKSASAAEARIFDPRRAGTHLSAAKARGRRFPPASGCVSCHNNSLFAMTVETAKQSGWQTPESDAARHRKTIGPYIEAWRDRALQGWHPRRIGHRQLPPGRTPSDRLRSG